MKNVDISSIVERIFLILLVLMLSGCVPATKELYAPTSWPTYYETPDQIKKYFTDNLNSLDRIEGIWDLGYNFTITNPYTTDKGTKTRAYEIAIIKKGFTEKNEFVGIVLQSNNDNWTYGRVKAKFVKTATPDIYQGIYYPLEFQEIGCYYNLERDGMISTSVNYETRVQPTLDVTEDVFMLRTFPLTSDIESPTVPTKANGSGFLLDKKGLIITCAHVVDGFNSIKVRAIINETEKILSASIISIDQNNDIAILKVDLSNYENEFSDIPIVITDRFGEVGEKVYALGYPLPGTMGEDLKLTDGIISSTKGFQNNINYYQVSAPVQPGNSGGPLLDDEGNVIGLINAKHLNTENVGYALKSTVLNNFLKLSLTNKTIYSENKLKDKSLPERYKILKNYIFIIEAE